MSTHHHQPTVGELHARIQELEDRLHARQKQRSPARGRVRAIVTSLAVAVGVAVIPSFAGAAPAQSTWSLIGNAGTNPNTNYLGTADSAGLSIRTNGMQAIGIDANQNVTVKGSLNAQGGMQENGTPLSNEYVKIDGSNARATSAWGISISGNAGTVTNGLYSTGSYADPGWLTSVAGSKITGNIAGNAAGFTGSLSGDVSGTQGATRLACAHDPGLSHVTMSNHEDRPRCTVVRCVCEEDRIPVLGPRALASRGEVREGLGTSHIEADSPNDRDGAFVFCSVGWDISRVECTHTTRCLPELRFGGA